MNHSRICSFNGAIQEILESEKNRNPRDVKSGNIHMSRSGIEKSPSQKDERAAGEIRKKKKHNKGIR